MRPARVRAEKVDAESDPHPVWRNADRDCGAETADRWVSNGAVTADDHWTLVDTTPDGDPRQIEDIIRRNLPDEGSGKGSRA